MPLGHALPSKIIEQPRRNYVGLVGVPDRADQISGRQCGIDQKGEIARNRLQRGRGKGSAREAWRLFGWNGIEPNLRHRNRYINVERFERGRVNHAETRQLDLRAEPQRGRLARVIDRPGIA